LLDRATGKELETHKLDPTTPVSYGETIRVPVSIFFNLRLTPNTRRELTLELRLVNDGKVISSTRDYVEVFSLVATSPPDLQLAYITCTNNPGPELERFYLPYKYALPPGVTRLPKGMQPLPTRVPRPLTPPPQEVQQIPEVWLLGPAGDFESLKPGGDTRIAVENGATAIVFSPGQKFTALFPSDIEDVRNAPGEYADFSPCAGTMLAEGLQPMDLKWWGRKDDWRVFVANTSHRLKAGSKARELIRYIPPHSYIPADKVKEQYRTVLFEIPLGKGRLWVCDLDLEASVSVDPLAQLFARNLLRSAADPASTEKLPQVPSHEELSKRK
jgi:hypothetical protein